MKWFLGAVAIIWSAALIALTHVGTREQCKYEPIRCKSPIEPKLEILVDGDKLDTTWIYVRNIER